MAKPETVGAWETLAEVQQVWDVFTNVDRWGMWLSGLESITRIKGNGFDVGSQWKETRIGIGSETIELLEIDAPRGAVFKVGEGEAADEIYYTFNPSPMGTRLEVAVATASPSGLMGRLMKKTSSKVSKAQRKQDLHDFANIAESKVRR